MPGHLSVTCAVTLAGADRSGHPPGTRLQWQVHALA
jgi:hypothetical protein